MTKNSVEHIIRRFGSQQRVAELLGIWQTAVSGWVRRGAIPARRQAELLAIARTEGIELAPADFFGLDEQQAATGTDGIAAPLPRPEPIRTGQPPMAAQTAEVIPLNPAARGTRRKDLYEVCEIPPLSHMPRNRYAWVISKERNDKPTS